MRGGAASYTITADADLPALDLRAGDLLTIHPQRCWDCCRRYPLLTGEVVRLGMGPRTGWLCIRHSIGPWGEIAISAINPQIVGRIIEVRQAVNVSSHA